MHRNSVGSADLNLIQKVTSVGVAVFCVPQKTVELLAQAVFGCAESHQAKSGKTLNHRGTETQRSE
jgi:hypothetical protein